MESRYDLSSIADILESNLMGRDLSIFWTMSDSSILSPSPLIMLTISSTQRKYGISSRTSMKEMTKSRGQNFRHIEDNLRI